MEPITVLSIISAGAFVYDRWKKSKEGSSLERFKLPSASGPNPEIGPAELESFTDQREGLRHFSRPVSDGLYPHYASARSAVAIPLGPIGPISPTAKVYRVVPLEPGKPTAAEVTELAFKEKKTVLGSLSLIGLGWGSTDPMLIVVGGPELLPALARAMPRGDFAVLNPKVERVEVVAPAEVVSEEAPAATPAAAAPAAAKGGKKGKHEGKANGASANGVEAGAAAVAAPTEVAKP